MGKSEGGNDLAVSVKNARIAYEMSLHSRRPRLRKPRGVSSSRTQEKSIREVSSFADAVESKAKLERVLGCTAISGSSVSVDEKKGIIAYPAGSTVVLHNPKTNAQAHLIGTSKNSLTCVSFSRCGKYVATGECGHEPRVRVWELYDQGGQFSFTQVADIKYHLVGIVCVRFTPDGNYLISVGNQHDKAIVIWEWRKQRNVAENRLTSTVNAMEVTEQGNSYVTVGIRHVKFWYVAGKSNETRSVPLQGRSAILAEQRNNTFLDVCCASNNRTFSITETKLLVEFHDKKLVSTYDLHGEMPRSLALGVNELFVGFNNGTIRCLDLETLHHKYSYCKPHYLLCDVASGTTNAALLPASHPQESRYPDVSALCYNRSAGVLTAVYNDHSMYSWQLADEGASFSKLSSQLFHVGAVNAVEIYPSDFPFLAPGSFISGGVDETIRIWNIDQRTKHYEQEANLSLPQTNVYSEELKKIVYLTKNAAALVDVTDKVPNIPVGESGVSGVRCLRVSPDGRHLAVGSKNGNVWVFDLTKAAIPQLALHEAHEGEVMCLEYSDPHKSRYLLASGSRDRLAHIFDPLNGYAPLATVEDHSSTVHSIVFSAGSDGLEMITCAADKLVVIRRMTESTPTAVRFTRTNQVSSQFGLNNLTSLDGAIVAACQDRQLRTYSAQGGKLLKQVKGSAADEGQLTKVRFDPSGTFAATVCSDRNVYIVEAATGDCAAVLSGHSEMVTDVGFSSDCRRLVVVSYSGCVFVWRLSNLLSNKMSAKLKKHSASTSHLAPTVEKVTERSETPDSLIGSGSDGASEELVGPSRSAKVKDSESEFGSLNSVKIADEDDDSCIGQKPAKVLLNKADVSPADSEGFELKRLTTEVVRRSSSGVLNPQNNSNWDIPSTANDYSDEEPSGARAREVSGRSVGVGYTTSRSMSNLRTVAPMQHQSGSSPRRSRKKWDMSGDVGGYASPMALHQSPSTPQGFTPYNSHSAAYNNAQCGPVPPQQSGFITMNGSGSHGYHTPTTASRLLDANYMNSAISMPGINQLSDGQHMGGAAVARLGMGSARSSVDSQGVSGGDVSRVGGGTTGGKPQVGSSPFQQQVQPIAAGNNDASFDRSAPERCSLTKRFLNNAPVHDEPRTVWTPPAMSARRSTSNMHYSTPSGGAAFAIVRRQSELHSMSGSRLYQQNGSSGSSGTAGGAASADDPKSIRRARTMHRLKNRRMTVGCVDQTPTTTVLSSPKEEDYVTSDLHLRSRSQSPSQLALNAIGDGSNSTRRQRQDSDMSLYSAVTMNSSRLTPASSRTNLRSIGPSMRQSSQAINKLNEMRDKLRKSQENLAGAIGDEPSVGASSSGSSSMSRSRSIGNLRFSAAAPLGGASPSSTNSGYLNTTFPVTQHPANEASAAYMPAASAADDRKNISGQGGGLCRSRFMARSVGSLHNNFDAGETGDDESRGMRQDVVKAPSRLAQTIENLKKASNPDLTQLSLYDNIAAVEDADGDAFYSSTSLSRNQRGKGAVQKRVERYQPRSRVSRDTTSGESDSNASDANSSPLLQGGASAVQHGSAKRYFSTVNGSNRSASSVEGMPRPGLLQSTRRIFEQQRHTSTPNSARRVPNYFAQKLAVADIVGPDMGGEECPRQPASPSEQSALHDFDAKSPQSKQMARHLAECIEQFNTGLDKVLQARQMLESSQHLPSDDKDTLMRVLNQTIRTGRKRLDVTDDRYEPDGGRSDSPNSISSQRQNAVQSGAQSGGTVPGSQGDIDPATFFQQHGHQLLALLQQNMAKQN